MKNEILGNQNQNGASKKIAEDIKSFKKDADNLLQQVFNIKDDSRDLMLEQLENVFSSLSTIKDKAIQTERDCAASLSSSTRRHPIRNLAYAFGAGVILAYIIGK